MSSPRIKFDDAVGAAHSLLHAMKRMAEVALDGEGEDYCAFTLLADSAARELSEAHSAFDALENRERPA